MYILHEVRERQVKVMVRHSMNRDTSPMYVHQGHWVNEYTGDAFTAWCFLPIDTSANGHR